MPFEQLCAEIVDRSDAMSAIRHLLDSRTSEVLQEQQAGNPLSSLCFKESDSIGSVLRAFARGGFASALVLRSAAVPDDAADPANRVFSTVYMRDIIGFVDLHVILQGLLRGACSRKASAAIVLADASPPSPWDASSER